MEGLLLRHPDVPALLPPVALQPPVHVHLLHRGDEGEDGRHGLGLPEGGRIDCVRWPPDTTLVKIAKKINK